MTGGAADLEAELAMRQKELDGNVAKHAKRTAQGLGEAESVPEYDPSEMVSKMKVVSRQYRMLNDASVQPCHVA